LLIDTHCHLFYDDLKNDLPGVLERANELGVTRFICVGTNLEDSRESLELAEKYEPVYASVGVHPHDTKDVKDGYLRELEELLGHPKVVACGEMGLDFFRKISKPTIQVKVFREQMELAQEMKKPVIFHNREADDDVVSILSGYPGMNGVAHCFSSDLATANSFLKLGYYISFAGNLTFKNSNLPRVGKQLPLERLMVETDSPYLSPVPFRGKPNEPGRTRFVAETLAEIQGISIETVASQTSENAKCLFGLKSELS